MFPGVGGGTFSTTTIGARPAQKELNQAVDRASRLPPAAPTVDFGTVDFGTVEFGTEVDAELFDVVADDSTDGVAGPVVMLLLLGNSELDALAGSDDTDPLIPDIVVVVLAAELALIRSLLGPAALLMSALLMVAVELVLVEVAVTPELAEQAVADDSSATPAVSSPRLFMIRSSRALRSVTRPRRPIP